jgi:hypothetical protein
MPISPRNGITYLEDGSADNIGLLAAALRTFDVITNMVLQSISTTATPTLPQPGQAWFVDKDSAVSGEWTSIIPAAAGRPDHLILAYVGTNVVTPQNSDVQFGWVSLKIDASAIAYVVDLGARYQFDGEDWTEQLKSQSSIWRKSYPPSGFPLGNPGSENYQVLVAPFDIKLTGARFMLEGGSVVSGTSKAAFIPGLYHSSDPLAAFPGSWTKLIEPTYSVSNGWAANSVTDFSTRAYETAGVSPEVGGGATWNTVVIPGGDYIAIGGWDNTSSSPINTLGTTFQIATIRQASLRLDYIRS